MTNEQIINDIKLQRKRVMDTVRATTKCLVFNEECGIGEYFDDLDNSPAEECKDAITNIRNRVESTMLEILSKR